MKPLTESILNGGAEQAADNVAAIQEILATVGKINWKFTGSLNNKVDSYGQPVAVGDVIIGSVQNQLTVCRIAEVYRNGMMVELGHMPTGGTFNNQPLDLKKGFVKIDPTLLPQIFPNIK